MLTVQKSFAHMQSSSNRQIFGFFARKLHGSESDCYNRSKFYIAGMRIDLFCSHHLDLDPMTFIHELDPNTAETQWMSENELPTSRLSKVIVWQT